MSIDNFAQIRNYVTNQHSKISFNLAAKKICWICVWMGCISVELSALRKVWELSSKSGRPGTKGEEKCRYTGFAFTKWLPGKIYILWRYKYNTRMEENYTIRTYLHLDATSADLSTRFLQDILWGPEERNKGDKIVCFALSMEKLAKNNQAWVSILFVSSNIYVG